MTERLTERSLILPLFHEMTEAQQEHRGHLSVTSALSGLERQRCQSHDGGAAVRELVVVGAGGFGRETVEAVRALNAAGARWRLAGYLDDERRTLSGR